jgi:hypothetical protein
MAHRVCSCGAEIRTDDLDLLREWGRAHWEWKPILVNGKQKYAPQGQPGHEYTGGNGMPGDKEKAK